jgi:hypothetical protein
MAPVSMKKHRSRSFFVVRFFWHKVISDWKYLQMKEIRKINDGHRGRLYTSLLNLEETHRQIMQAVRYGISPNSGQLLTPLQEDEWKALEKELLEMEKAMRDVVERYAGSKLKEREKSEDRNFTLFFLSVLMNELEDQLLLDLAPGELQANYGAVEEADAAVLQRLHEELSYNMQELKAKLQLMRASKGGSH